MYSKNERMQIINVQCIHVIMIVTNFQEIDQFNLNTTFPHTYS